MDWQKLLGFKQQLTNAGLGDSDADRMAQILQQDDEFGLDARTDDDLDHAAHCNLQLLDDDELDSELELDDELEIEEEDEEGDEFDNDFLNDSLDELDELNEDEK